MAALSWANSGSSMLDSRSEDLGFREGLAAVGRAGGFFWTSLWGQAKTSPSHLSESVTLEIKAVNFKLIKLPRASVLLF